MTPTNILDIRHREDFRRWLAEHHATAKECWIAVKRGKTPPVDSLWYLDAVEEALCFGWIDSTLKRVRGVALQRFGPRTKNGRWTELNKARCRRLVSLGQMTDSGLDVCPDLDADMVIDEEVMEAFQSNPTAWTNFLTFPALYRRVRIDNIQRNRNCRQIFISRLNKLIEASERGEMIGDWNDCGRLLSVADF